ncbi:MAG: hypothetical protein N3A54_00060 [Patescibacteria group bacterium]|nr:hypothetical protein [Patescibacteria group bacterium]
MAYFSASQYSVIELFGGEDFQTIVTVSENGVPINIENASNLRFTVRKSFFYNKSVHNFFVEKLTPYSNGSFKVTYPASLTKTMKAGNHVFDFFIDLPNASGGTRTMKVAEGIIVVYPAATTDSNTYYPF